MGKIKYGIKNVYYAIATQGTDSSGDMTYTYGTPVAMPGAVSMSLQAAGDSLDEYADDILWFHDTANNGYTGTLEMEVIPDDFLTNVMGMTEDSASGKITEKSTDTHKEFALLGEFTFGGDTVTGKRFAMYRCIASRPDVSGTTKGASIEAQHDSINITCMPRPTDNAVKATCVSSDTAWSSWFSSVS